MLVRNLFCRNGVSPTLGASLIKNGRPVLMNDLKYLFKLGLDPTSGIQLDPTRAAGPHQWDAGGGLDPTSGIQAGAGPR